MKTSPVLAALRKAAQGLLFISESEAALEPFLWEVGALTTERLLQLAGAAEGTAVEQTTLDRFFRAVSKEDRPKFDALAKVLSKHLEGITVYKIGDEAEKPVFVVGKTQTGEWAGLQTSVVET